MKNCVNGTTLTVIEQGRRARRTRPAGRQRRIGDAFFSVHHCAEIVSISEQRLQTGIHIHGDRTTLFAQRSLRAANQLRLR